MKPEPDLAPDLLDLDVRQAWGSSRRALFWLAGLFIALVAASILLLALFLRDVEAQEQERRRAADAQWLEQTLRFHFTRLERDLAQLERDAPPGGTRHETPRRAGLLWRGDEVIAWQGWLTPEQIASPGRWPDAMMATERQAEASGMLAVMLDTGRGLRRAAYAGPLPASDPSHGLLLWLAVPRFERDRFVGSQVAAIRLDRALEQIVPAWFLAEHALLTLDDEGLAPTVASASSYPVAVQLPGTQWKLAVELLQAQPATAPRAFFGIALISLSTMLVALYFLWRGWLRRQRVEQLAARQQQQLEASGRLVAVGEVASTLAHELNQPLGALSSFTSGLLNRVRQGSIALPEIVPVLERIERMAEKAGRVIQRVNAFARRQEMSRQPLALAPFVRRVTQHLPLPDGMALQLQLPETDTVVWADALLLEHALRNLVLNASEWADQRSDSPATVRISLAQDGGMAGIRVEDNGPGIPEAQRTGIFDAFRSGKPGGMGMGLSICRSIAEAHHGRIEVSDSQALHGAQFTLWLPLTT